MYPRTLVVLALFGAACGNAQTRPQSSPPSSGACLANPAWITNPRPPSEVASDETFCDFYQFSWQWFLAQVSPANPANPNGDRVFEATNRVVIPDTQDTNQCAKPGMSGRAAAIKALAIRTIKPNDFEDVQADKNPLYDQGGNVLYYNMWYSPEECKATSSGFTTGTMELKTAWRVLPAADPTYFHINAVVPIVTSGGVKSYRPAVLGLVGFHLVNWTSKHPEMIWATFEHKSNAPLCSGASTSPSSGWSFASAAAAQCLAQNPSPNGQLPSACASFDFNNPPKASNPVPTSGTPDEVCELFKDGTDSGTAVNGNDNQANALAIDQLNQQLIGPNGLLTKLPSENPMAVWENYQMVGGIWTKNGQASGSPPPVPSTSKGQPVPPNPNSPQRGSLELTNVTMETYQQGPTSSVPNCFGCHNYVPATPVGVSHIATKYLLPPPTASLTPMQQLTAAK